MRKILSIILVFTFVFTFAACGTEKSINSVSDTEIPVSENQIGSENIEITQDKLENKTDGGSEQQNNSSMHTSKLTENSKPSTSVSVHIHNYSTATCTQPKKCSCGATDGNALGHSWNNATCISPKICSVCKITEGAVNEHNFQNGKCNYCKTDDVIELDEKILINTKYIGYKFDSDNFLRVVELKHENGQTFHIYTRYYCESDNNSCGVQPIVYNGKTYYGGDGGGMPLNYTLKNNFVEFALSGSDFKAVYVMQHDTTLRLISGSPSDAFPEVFEICN